MGHHALHRAMMLGGINAQYLIDLFGADLLALYPQGEEPGATTIADATGNGHDLTPTNVSLGNEPVTAKLSGTSADYNGVSSLAEGAGPIVQSNQICIGVFLYWTGKGTGSTVHVLGYQGEAGKGWGWGLRGTDGALAVRASGVGVLTDSGYKVPEATATLGFATYDGAGGFVIDINATLGAGSGVLTPNAVGASSKFWTGAETGTGNYWTGLEQYTMVLSRRPTQAEQTKIAKDAGLI